MSSLRVSSLRGETDGSSPTFPDGVVVSGVVTSTTFSGNLTGNVTGNISGTTGSFSGNVSVGGTLTYGDVTNIDLVGVITARSGIKVGAGQSISAVSGTLTYYGDGSQLTGVSAGGEADFVASGTIPNGSTVIIKDDGTVGVVESVGSDTPTVGTAAVFESAATESPVVIYDSVNGKVVIGYRDKGESAQPGTAVVGTVNSDNTITFGTPVVFESGQTEWIGGTYDSDSGKVVFAYQDWSDNQKGKACVGTVSGNSISFGSPVEFESNEVTYIRATFDSTNNKVVIVYRDQDVSGYGKGIVGTVSGTSISFGSAATFNSGSTAFMDVTYDSNAGKVVVAYRDGSDSDNGKARVGTVSGNGISWGSVNEFNAGNTPYNALTFDSTNNKVILAYRDGNNSNYGTVRVGTVSGTTITFGSEVVFESANSIYIFADYDSTNQKVIITYVDAGNSSRPTGVVGTVSGTSISFGTPLQINTSSPSYMWSAYVGSNKSVVGYNDSINSNHGTAVVFTSTSLTTNLTAENYIGIAAEAISDGQTGKVNIIGGVNSGQTGLTTAQTYYVQNDGSLGLTAASPSVVAGTSISSTEILVR